MAAELKPQIPVLTETVDDPASGTRGAAPATPASEVTSEPASPDDREALIAELQTQIAAGAFAMTDEIMRAAFAEMEANIFARISGQLRSELPELIDGLLRERLGDNSDD